MWPHAPTRFWLLACLRQKDSDKAKQHSICFVVDRPSSLAVPSRDLRSFCHNVDSPPKFHLTPSFVLQEWTQRRNNWWPDNVYAFAVIQTTACFVAQRGHTGIEAFWYKSLDSSEWARHEKRVNLLAIGNNCAFWKNSNLIHSNSEPSYTLRKNGKIIVTNYANR